MEPESTTKSSTQRRVIIGKPVVWIILSVLSTIALKALVVNILPSLTSVWDDWWATTIGTCAMALIGWGLFRFRKINQTLYGFSEICFSITAIWINLAKLQSEAPREAQPNATRLLAVVAATYLIVRGFINLEEAKKRGSPNQSF
jgi:hypothetical protein